MPYFLDTQETSQRFSSQIAEFCSLFDTNHIRHGSPDDLIEFARALENSNQFRLDLSAMVKSIMRKGNDEFLLTDMMSIIAAAVGGPSFADAHADLTKPTNALMEFLLGTGCWRQFGSPSSRTSQNIAPDRQVPAEERPPIRISSPSPPSSPTPPEKSENRAEMIDASGELRQTLTRLEINTLQVKLHLDAIEQRLSRMNSSPEALSTSTLPSPESPQRVAYEAVTSGVAPSAPAEEVPVIEPELPTRGRAVFSHEPLLTSPEMDDFSSPTFAYATEKRRGIVPIALFLVLLAIIVASIFFARSEQGHALVEAGTSRFKAAFSSALATIHSAPAKTLPPSASPPSPAPTNPSSASATPTPAPSGPITHSSTSAPVENARSNISSEARSFPAPSNSRYVAPNIMEGNLLSAPRPEYPQLARLHHVEGTVALQATISRGGSIKTLHAISGPQSLRSAAVAAVRNWRYKPYIINGQPVDVATTVYVDFSLRPPPAIAH